MSGNPSILSGSRSHRLGLRISVVVALVAALMSTAASGHTDASCTTKPDVYPVDQLHKGQPATGYTVIDGTTQTPFDVKILGVDPGGIAPGVDFILAQITGPAAFVKDTGGIVAGMSGSPVYIGSDLVGSTSYGFFGADQTIMGITPAQPMVDLFDYPDAPSSAAAVAAARAASSTRTVRLSPALRLAAARAEGKSAASAFPGSAHQLRVPLAVSGVGSRGLSRLRAFIRNRLHLSVRVYGVSGTSAGTGSAPLTAGDSLAAAISYGDLTAGAIGTATAVCGDMVVGFGHPFGFTGGTSLGMNGADVLKVIKDPSNLFGGFKFATIGDLHGTVDQDRLTGIRGVEGLLPTLMPVNVHVDNLDIPGKHRDGGSQIAAQDFAPIVSALTLLNDEDVTFDRIGDGSVDLGWTIRGTHNGTPFVLRRDDKYFSEYDATIESLYELLYEMIFLQESHFGDVSFTSVGADSQVTQQQLTMGIRSMLVSSSLQPGLAVHKTLKVKPGDTIHARIVLVRHGGTTPVNVNLALRVPLRASGDGYLFSRGGRFFDGLFAARRAGSFSELVSKLANAEHNYDLVTDMFLFGGGGGKAVSRRIHTQVRSPQDRVVLGRRFVRIDVVRPGGGGGGPAPSPSPKG